MGSGVFINYRGEDSETAAALIDRELVARFGGDRVFLDSRSIPAGVDFVEELLGRLRACSVLLVVIGPRWLTLTDAAGGRRIDDPRDWIRREIEEALGHGLRVIPVLTDGVLVPAEVDLPAAIAGLSRRQHVPLRRRYTSVDLAFLVERIVDTEPGLARVAAGRLAGPAGPAPAPCQLPAAVAHFVGRTAELATLTALLPRGAEGPSGAGTGGTVAIAAISGTAGVGKTALAVHWAHQVAGRFPDGQLYANLRGFDPGGGAVEPAEALRRFLEALWVPPERIPVDLDAQAALYRSQLAGKRVLVVLDNARDSAQVRRLLPGAPSCVVVVTSRNRLTGVIATDAALPVNLGLLTGAQARQLLARRLGADRVAAEPAAVEEIIGRCSRLPLALAIAAARAVSQAGVALRTLAAELRGESGRLDALTTDDPATEVRAVFSWSYRALTPGAARLFRLLGLHPGPDFSAAAAASVAGMPAHRVRPLLAELVRTNLVMDQLPGRHTLHDLLRSYATERAAEQDPRQRRRAATARILGHYLHTAHAAARLLNPTRDAITLAPAAPGVTPESLAGHDQALAWFTAEHAVLLAAVDRAATAGFDLHAWQLAWTLTDYLDRRGYWRDWLSSQHTALATARRLRDPLLQARTHRALAGANTELGRFDESHEHLRDALDLYGRAGDRTGQAHTQVSIAFARERQGRYDQALEHAELALDLFRAIGHRHGQADTLNAIGWLHARLGNHGQTLAHCRQALPLLQELGDRLGEAYTWDSLGFSHHNLGDHAEAMACYRQALAMFRTLGDRFQEAASIDRIGDTQHAAGDPQAAREAWQDALLILDDLDHADAGRVRAKLAQPDPQPRAPPGSSAR